ncbi:hypothetical protein BDQ12DRAFT_246537 [Crucibulum laeve]|uniref:Uncharacterized protein n=1 Tax=Crucibulum laeve TaxID=68775 RepID=A0A5C3LDS4_9AGAR|nr:hypothetical protein BDQ12DRAFT_246537 [Crucibulum laeve]
MRENGAAKTDLAIIQTESRGVIRSQQEQEIPLPASIVVTAPSTSPSRFMCEAFIAFTCDLNLGYPWGRAFRRCACSYVITHAQLELIQEGTRCAVRWRRRGVRGCVEGWSGRTHLESLTKVSFEVFSIYGKEDVTSPPHLLEQLSSSGTSQGSPLTLHAKARLPSNGRLQQCRYILYYHLLLPL